MRSTVSGRLLQTPTPDRLDDFDAVVVIDEDGTIESVHDRATPDGAEAAAAAVAATTDHIELPDGAFLLPGLVDLHVHAPQWPQLGTGLDLPLERWLFDYTFPLEARYGDVEFAQAVWTDLVSTLLAHGTTTAVYYGSIHVDATTALARTCVDAGQRALVGRVAMDHPDGTPDWYRDDSASAGVERSLASIEAVRGVGRGLVEPVVTPRFTPACTDALLAGLGELAESLGVRVQTHCSESDWQHQYALDRFSTADAMALERFGLLRRNTVLAHADHLTTDDVPVVISRQAGVAHCPLSNAYFANAVFPARRSIDAGLRVGLGTDIAGGAKPSLLGQCHDAVTVSRLLDGGVDATLRAPARGVAGSHIDTITAFWMATVGGAAVVDLPVGLIEPGRRFDAIAVDTNRPGGSIRLWDDLDDRGRVFEKIVRLATADDISRVWVDGATVRVSGAAGPSSTTASGQPP